MCEPREMVQIDDDDDEPQIDSEPEKSDVDESVVLSHEGDTDG